MTRIGAGGPRPPTEGNEQVGKTPAENKTSQPAEGQSLREAAGKDVPKRVVDSFVRAEPALSQRLQAMAGKKALPGLTFTSEHLAQVAQAFAGLLRKSPNADRRARARMFAKAILGSKKFSKIFDEADEEDLENMYDVIGDQLDGSPVLAQLVDDVTEGARKLNLG